jgi:excisionase family DNA binding protein
MQNSRTTGAPEPLALKMRGACQRLNVSRSTMNRLIKSGAIRPNRKLRHLLIPISELNKWLGTE